MTPSESLLALCLLLFLDGATLAIWTTPLLLKYGRFFPAWQVALAGGAASALGSALQLMVLRWAMHSSRPWMARFAPSRDKLEGALKRYPSASFLALVIARATPISDAPLKLVAAAGGYPVGLYALAILLGALPYYYVLALIGHAFEIPTWVLVTLVAAIVAGVLLDRLRRRRHES